MSFHYAEALYWSLRRSLQGCATEEVIPLIEDNLNMVVETFGEYRLGSSEKDRSTKAESLLKKLESEIK